MASLAGTGENAEPYIRHYAQVIEKAGADVLFVICNTAHAYHSAVQRTLRIPWVHLMDITVGHIRDTWPSLRAVGVLGTDGTLNTQLYHRALQKRGLVAIAPGVSTEPQRLVMDAIFEPTWGIKATGANISDRARRGLATAAEWCAGQGAQVVVAACTEVSVGLTPDQFSTVPLVDPLAVAAEVLLDLAYGIRDPGEFLVRDV
jgi:aspartate racemase